MACFWHGAALLFGTELCGVEFDAFVARSFESSVIGMLTISARACFTQVSLPFLQVIPLKGGGRCLFVIAEIFALQLEAF